MVENSLDRREYENRTQQEKRLPPGQSLTTKLSVLHYSPVPPVDLDSCDFCIYGDVWKEQRVAS